MKQKNNNYVLKQEGKATIIVSANRSLSYFSKDDNTKLAEKKNEAEQSARYMR